MIPASAPIRSAAVTLLTTGAGQTALDALGVLNVTVSPDEDEALPFVEVQGATEIEAGRSDQARQTQPTLTVVARADTMAKAESIGTALVSLLGSRFTADDVQVTGATLDLYGPAFRDPPPGARPWSLPLRFRYTAFQSADPGE